MKSRDELIEELMERDGLDQLEAEKKADELLSEESADTPSDA